MAMRAPAVVVLATLLLAGCNNDVPEPEPIETEVPEELAQGGSPDRGETAERIGTPMAERVATIGLLNKRNNVSRDFEISPGEAIRAGDVVIRVEACEKTAPWELPQEEGAFVQVFMRENARNPEDATWNKIFSGWLFRNSPSLNVVEHPVYDVWIKECAMSFPGEES